MASPIRRWVQPPSAHQILALHHRSFSPPSSTNIRAPLPLYPWSHLLQNVLPDVAMATQQTRWGVRWLWMSFVLRVRSAPSRAPGVTHAILRAFASRRPFSASASDTAVRDHTSTSQSKVDTGSGLGNMSEKESTTAAASTAGTSGNGKKRTAPPGYKLIEEGSAAMLFGEQNEVFYNKVQVLNRDLSITMIRLFAERRLRDKMAKELKKEGLEQEAITKRLAEIDWTEKVKEKPEEDGLVILDALAASGLRSIRYMKEIPGVKKVVVNDLEEMAVEQARKNVEFNEVDPTRVTPNQANASVLMLQSAQSPATQFDVVDIDPYGSAAPFLDSAVQSVSDGGMLCVTCTDMAVLNGNHPEACYSKYRCMPTKGRYMHELSVRIVLAAIESQANRYKRYIEPLLGVAVDFYLRVFVRVHNSPAEVKRSLLKHSYVYQSLGCGSFYTQEVGRMTNGSNYSSAVGPTCPPACPETGKAFKIGGPFWSAPMHDMEWVMEAANRVEEAKGEDALPTKDRLLGLLTSVSEELPDVPLFYTLKDLCGTVHCVSPRMDEFKAALINGGYRVSNQHYEPQAIKTDAPPNVIWDIMRCWVKKHPVGNRGKKDGSPAAAILAKEPEFQANFSVPAVLRQPKKKVKRYPPNPEAFWGPKSRARPRKRKASTDLEADGAGAAEAPMEGVEAGGATKAT